MPRLTPQRLGNITSVALPGMPQTGQPFGIKGTDSSMDKYQSTGQRYVGFCARAYRLGREAAYDTLAAKFIDEQWSLLRDMIDEAEIASTRGPQSPLRIKDDTSRESSEDSDEESDAAEP